MIGLLLIALGTGGIKPCVSAFGGDQFNANQVCSVIIVTLQDSLAIYNNETFLFTCITFLLFTHRSIYSKAIFPFSILPLIWVAFYR